MPERYAKLSPDVRIFRTAKLGGGYLPAGHVLPKPEWLEPNKVDEDEAKQTGRPPGVSVWALPDATHEMACWIRSNDPAEQRSFVIRVGILLMVAQTHTRVVSVVADGLPHPKNNLRWPALTQCVQNVVRSTCDAHSLIEGIKRPAQLPKITHQNFREELARKFESLA
jgi:hypothetical protein